MYKHIYILTLTLISFSSIGQTLIGTITDNNKDVLPGTNIVIKGKNTGVSSDSEGKYSVELISNRSVVIEVSFIGFGTKNIRIPMLKNGQIYTLDIQLSPEGKLIDDVIVKDKKTENNPLVK